MCGWVIGVVVWVSCGAVVMPSLFELLEMVVVAVTWYRVHEGTIISPSQRDGESV